MNREALMRKLMGIQDPRGMMGMMSRGANVYNGASLAAHRGPGYPGQYGRPRNEAILRLLLARKVGKLNG